jgi:hypothetical protein
MKFKRNADGSLVLDDAGNPILEDAGEEVNNIVQSKVSEELKAIKEKLDNAYKARDAAAAKAAELAEAQRLADVKRLEDEGKHAEVAQMKISHMEGQLKAAQARITELTRDAAVDSAIGGLNFQSPAAAKAARREIIDQLVCDENGVWMHKTGVSIKDAVLAFEKHEDNAFLFKPKQTTGTGFDASGKPIDTSAGIGGRKMSDIPVAEMLALAAQGKIKM